MSKKRNVKAEESERQSRKEVLRARRQSEQSRQIRIVIAIVLGIILLVFGVALVNEYLLVPNQPVANVRGEEIALGDWQDRVRYQRAQFIINMEDQLESFGDVGLVQQFNGQQIQLLQDGQELGRLVLEQMVDETIIRQEAAKRNITVSSAEIDAAIGEQFSYYGGEAPTPLPTPTQTIMPTPSLTPIPTAVITEALPTQTPLPTPTVGPTGTPLPTATPVSSESFQESLDALLGRYRKVGVSEATFRSAVEAQLYREKLAEALGEEQGVATEEEQASAYFLIFDTQEEADATLAQIGVDGFLTVWNTVRSASFDANRESTASANEQLWRPREQYESNLGADVAAAIFDEPISTPSGVIEVPGVAEGDPSQFIITMASGREIRPVAETTISNAKFQLVSDLITTVRNTETVELLSLWRTRVPGQPILDPKFLVQPTPVPTEVIPTPEPLPTDDGT